MRPVLLSLLLCAAACGDDMPPGNNPDAGTPDADTDGTAPDELGPVTELVAAYDGPANEQVQLSWTNNAQASGVLIVRATNADPGAPTDGTVYVAGDDFPGAARVVFVGSASDAADTEELFDGDELRYAVFSFDADNAYSEPAAVSVVVDESIPAQPGSFSIDLANEVVTVTNPPDASFVATASYDDVADVLTLNVTTTNNAGREVFNPKLVVVDTNEAASVPAGDIDFGGSVALYSGPNVVLDGGSLAGALTFSNVSGGVDPYVVNVTLRADPMIALGGELGDAAHLLDSSGAGTETIVSLAGLGFGGNGDAHAEPGVFDPDGDKLYIGHGQQPAIVVVDLMTGQAVNSTDLTGANDIQNDGTGSVGHVASVTDSPDHRYLYAVLVTGEHRFYSTEAGSGAEGRAAGTANIELVRIDRVTLTEVDRLTLLADSDVRPRASTMAMSRDGKLGAVAIRRAGALAIINLETMELDGALVDTSAQSTEPRHVAISADSSQVFIAYRGDGQGGPAHGDALDIYDRSAQTFTALAMTNPTNTTNNKVGFLEAGPDGRIFYGRKNGGAEDILSIIDLGASSEVELSLNLPNAIMFSPDGATYTVTDGGRQLIFNTNDDSAATFPATGLGQDDRDQTGQGHMGIITRH